jgi:hypothetical protein
MLAVVDIDPLWRPLPIELAEHTPVIWEGVPGPAPQWFTGRFQARVPSVPTSISCELCADPRSEVIEALRWVRELLSSGRVKARDIGIAATAPSTWDDHMLALSKSAGLPIHFSHGVPALSTPKGHQA